MAYGQALRVRVLRFYDAGEKTVAIARRLDVSPSWCRRVRQHRDRPPAIRRGRSFRLDAAACIRLTARVEQQPDSTLDELRAWSASELGLTISVGALWSTLRRLKLTLKKKSLVASEQERPDVQEDRANFFAQQLKDVPLQDIVVLDESYATTAFTRPRGRCPVNQRLRQRVPAGHWKRLTILAAITVAGVLTAATIDASTDGPVFSAFISDALVPTLRPGMVVVMDNLSSHKIAGIRESIESAGCRLVYLHPYSPDMSPIENIWSKAKAVIKTLDARTVPDLEAAVTLALETITALDCLHCFNHCGYSLQPK